MTHPPDGDDIAQRVRLALEDEHGFGLALRSALASPSQLEQEFQNLVFWMSDLVDTFDQLELIGDSIINDLGDAFQQGYEEQCPDYTRIREIVRLYDVRNPSEGAPKVITGSSAVSGAARGDSRPPDIVAATILKSTTEPPLPPLDTKPATALTRSVTSQDVTFAIGAAPRSNVLPRSQLSNDTRAGPSKKKISPANTQETTPEEFGQYHFSETVRGHGVDGRTSSENAKGSTQSNWAGQDDKSQQQNLFRMQRAGEQQYVKEKSSSECPVVPDNSSTQETLVTGKLVWEEVSYGGDGPNSTEPVIDNNDSVDASANKARHRLRMSHPKKSKKAPPPDSERQYYPKPCLRCKDNALPCFLPHKCRASRRTCWHCSGSKARCSYAVNTDMLAHDTVVLTKEEPWDVEAEAEGLDQDEEGQHLLKGAILRSNTQLRDEIAQLTGKITTMIECFENQEGKLGDFCMKQEESLVARLTESLEQAIRPAINTLVEELREIGPPRSKGTETDHQQQDDYLSDQNEAPETHQYGRAPLLPPEERTRSNSVGLSAPETEKRCATPSMSHARLRDGGVSSKAVGQARRGHDTKLRDMDNAAGSRFEKKAVHSDRRTGIDSCIDVELATAIEAVWADCRAGKSQNPEDSDARSLNNPSLRDRSLSPLSDIPEEEESVDGEECDEPRCPPFRVTRSVNKRKEAHDVAGRFSPAKKAKGSVRGRKT